MMMNNDVLEKITKFNLYLTSLPYVCHPLRVPDSVLLAEGGSCLDLTCYEARWFGTFYPEISVRTYFIHDKKSFASCHAFLLFELDNSCYWFESAVKPWAGVHKFTSKNKALAHIENLFKNYENCTEVEMSQFNAGDPSIIGMSDIEFYRYIRKEQDSSTLKNFARTIDTSTILRKLLSVIDSISVGGLTKYGVISQDTDVPDDFVCQPPAWTLKHKVGQCDSIAALIASECDKLGWRHYDFVTECAGISLWEVSHFFTIIQTPLGFTRGDMSVDYMEANGLLKFSPTLKGALDLYCAWARKQWRCKKIILHPYNASDRKYYGMDFNSEIEDIVGAKKPVADYSELLGVTYDPVATHTRTVSQLLRDCKGICFDFVNYLYQKNNCRGECYFLWFNDKNRSTHTIYIDPEGYWIEATPDPGILLQEVRRNKIPLNEIINHLVKQKTGGVRYADDNPLYYCVKYVPENRRMTLDEFFNRRFDEIGV